MAINTDEVSLVHRFFPGGKIVGIAGYYAPVPNKEEGSRTPKTEFIGIRPVQKINTIGNFNFELVLLMNKGASRVELEVLDKSGKKDFVEFHIERLVPIEMQAAGKAKDCSDFMELVKEMRKAQNAFARNSNVDNVFNKCQLETAVDLKIAEMQSPEPDKNQLPLFPGSGNE